MCDMKRGAYKLQEFSVSGRGCQSRKLFAVTIFIIGEKTEAQRGRTLQSLDSHQDSQTPKPVCYGISDTAPYVYSIKLD